MPHVKLLHKLCKILPPKNPKTAAKDRSETDVVNSVDTNVSNPATVIPTDIRTSLNTNKSRHISHNRKIFDNIYMLTFYLNFGM